MKRLIPRDKDLLSDLYWKDNLSLTEIGYKFGCRSHSAAADAFKELNIPVRKLKIPRDRELLYKLYWEDGMTLMEMGEFFGCTDHSSLRKVLVELNIPRRRHTVRSKCIDCGKENIKRISHKLTSQGYGRRCGNCQKEHKRALAKEYIKKPEIIEKRKLQQKRAYIVGPLYPKGEKQWITKGRILLRTARRMLKQEAGQYQKKESEQVQTLQT